MFCQNCGKMIDDKAVICPDCGVMTSNMPQQSTNSGLVLAAKVFIIIGIVSQSLAILMELIYAFIFVFIMPVLIIVFLLMIAYSVVGIVFGAVTLKKMSSGKPSVAYSVLILIFTNMIGGILLLCTKDTDYEN